MTAYYRWIKSDSPDLTTALESHKLTSHIRDKESRSALWIFRLDKDYRPGAGVEKGRTLVAIIFNGEGEKILENSNNQIDWEDMANFKGEAKHPTKVIVKDNEQGARGIGRELLKMLNARIKEIRKANAREIKKATR